MHQSSFHRMERFAEHVRDRFRGGPLRVLDVGSAGVNGTYRTLFEFPGVSYLGLDIEPGPNVDVVPQDPYAWDELADESFDVIISGQALEHVEFPWLTVAQMGRKLKIGGLSCLIVPSRGPEHRYPVDCYRYYPDGLRALARWGGLRVLESDYARDQTGFTDGSDRWGDCYCILTRDAADHSAPTLPPSAPFPAQAADRVMARRRASEGGAGRGAALRHAYNPLRHSQGREASYFGHAREEVLQVMSQVFGQELGRPGKGPARVLELGCAGGATGRKIKERYGAHVTGIELAEDAAAIARAGLDVVHVADLERLDEPRLRALGLAAGSFDVLLALDVLEHLYDPWEALCRYTDLLRPGGHVVLSVPNIQNITTMIGLSDGQWNYQADGLLDATHVRFFTLPTADLLVTGAGMKLVNITTVFNPALDQSRLKDEGNDINHGRLTLSNLAREEVFCFFAYQYILVAQKPEAV